MPKAEKLPWGMTLNGASCAEIMGSNLNGFAAVNRGGNWNDGTNAGLATANLNNGPGNRNSNIGFRAASLSCVFLPEGDVLLGCVQC